MSTWELKDIKQRPELRVNTSADVAIVGGGLAGLWCAYLLAKEGKKVIVLEKDRVGKGETEYTTAFITQVIDTALSDLARMFSMRTARLVWQSGSDAIDLIERVVNEEKIDCEFMRIPIHTYARDEKEFRLLADEHEEAKVLGFETEMLKNVELGFPHEGVWRVPRQAKYHPMKFVRGLADAAERSGAVIYEKTEVVDVVGNAPVKVVTQDGKIVEAEHAIIATYDPLGNPGPTRFKKGMYVSYVLGLGIPQGEIEEGMYMDTHNPYHYVRVDKMGGVEDRVIVGGEDHRSELKVPAEKNFRALEQYVRETFPGLKYKVKEKWKGGILEPSDGLALIGRISERQFAAAAFSGNGMTYSAIAGRLIADLILGRDNSYAGIYDPKRRMRISAILHKARDYTGEFFGGAAKNFFK